MLGLGIWMSIRRNASAIYNYFVVFQDGEYIVYQNNEMMEFN